MGIKDGVFSRMAKKTRNGVRGAACVTRTRDPVITNDVLYQLSYCGPAGVINENPSPKNRKTLVLAPC